MTKPARVSLIALAVVVPLAAALASSCFQRAADAQQDREAHQLGAQSVLNVRNYGTVNNYQSRPLTAQEERLYTALSEYAENR